MKLDSDVMDPWIVCAKIPEERAKERRNYNEMFQAFLAHARSRGFFDGCEKGTPEYNLKIQQCIAKFEELKAKNL